jgi:hypothetical protein
MTKTIRVNWNESYDVLITRPSKFSNPFSHKQNTLALYKTNSRKESIQKFKEYFESNKELQNACEQLKGKRIACQCKSNQSCHGDVYVDFLENCPKINLENL